MTINKNTIQISAYHEEAFIKLASGCFCLEKVVNLFPTSQPCSKELLSDLFWLIYSDFLEILPMEKVSLPARLNYLIVDRLVKNQQFQGIRSSYRGDKVRAFFAAVELFNNLIKTLPADIIETAIKLEDAFNTFDKIRKTKEFLYRGISLSEIRRSPALFLWSREHLKNERKYQEAWNRLRSVKAELMRLWYSGCASRVMQELNNEFGCLEGNNPLANNKKSHETIFSKKPVLNLRSYLEKASIYSSNPKLKAIANKALSLKKAVSQNMLRGNSGYSLQGICTGDEIENLLSEEWSEFFTDSRKISFLVKLHEQQLWMLEFTPFDMGEGTLVICVDCSGSMQGIKEEKAKALTLCFLDISRLMRRDCVIILFGDKNCIEILECPDGQIDEKKFFTIINTFFSSKTTDFSRPLQEALRLNSLKDMGQMDLLFITDGLGSIESKVSKMITREEESGRIHTWAFIIEGGQKGTGQVEVFSRRVYDERFI